MVTGYVRGAAVAALLALIATAALGAQNPDGSGRRSPDDPRLSRPRDVAEVLIDELRARDRPTTVDSTVLMLLRLGERFPVLQRSSQRVTIGTARDFWYQLDVDGIEAWVFGGFLEIRTEVAPIVIPLGR